MKIRKYQNKDVDQVADLVYRTVKTMQRREPQNWSSDYLSRWDIKKKRKEIDILMRESAFVYVAQYDGKIEGMVRVCHLWKTPLSEKKYHLNSLYVNPALHGTGVGASLIKAVLKELKKRDAYKIRVFSSMSAVGFYEKVGFKKSTGKKKHYHVWTQPMHLFIKKV